MKIKLALCMLMCAIPVCAQSTLDQPSFPSMADAPFSDCPQDQPAPGPQPAHCEPARSVRPASLNATDRREDSTAEETTRDRNRDSQDASPPRTPPAPEIPRTEFELFVRDVTGNPVRNYGTKLFEQPPSTFAPLDRIAVPAGYALGPGDELLIRAWGKIDINARVTVDRNGQIYLPRIGALAVAGLRFAQLDGFLHTAVGALYKDFELNVTLGQLRSIQIFVLGNARRPGAYTLSSLSTLVNALFASGGPSANGSMRHIQLVRDNRTATDFDLYGLVRNGDKSHDQQLLPGDIIFIPPAGPRAAITGSVNEPGIYELSGEATIAAGLRAAGGLSSLAGAQRVLLERIDNHSTRSVQEFTLDAAGMQQTLKDGDLLQVFPVSPRIQNSVTLRGHVAQPGPYAWHEGMRITDLITSRDAVLTRAYWNRQNHVIPRERPQTVANGDHPRTAVPASPQEPDTAAPAAPGEEKADTAPAADQPEDPSRRKDDVVKTDIVRNDTEINWHYASIERLDEHDLSPRLVPFNLLEALDHPASPENQLLRPGDVVTVFSRQDIPLPVEEHASFVRLDGEVNAPGVYRVNAGETLREAVARAGGLTPHSYLFASQLLRESTRRTEEEGLRKATEQMERELVSHSVNTSQLNPPTTQDQQAQLSLREAVIARLSSVRPTGRVVLEMKPEAQALADIPEFTLEDGDSFYIPPRSSTVQVSGAVYNENAFRFQQNKLATAYLADAGGATRDADVKRIFLIRADGTIVSRQTRGQHHGESFARAVLLPGDAIVVPVRLTAPGGLRQLQELTGILSQTALTAASLSVIQR